MKPFTKKIVLENGREFYGYGFGADREVINEIVFNTSMVGYQEIMSDPSYTDQMVVMTYPLIGNYGMADEDYETKTPTIGGMIVREYNDSPSNFRYTKTLSEVFEEHAIPGIEGVDTRMLTRIIRNEGSQRVMITSVETPREEALARMAATPWPHDMVSRVSCRKRWMSRVPNHKYDVVAVDCGIKYNIIEIEISTRYCKIFRHDSLGFYIFSRNNSYDPIAIISIRWSVLIHIALKIKSNIIISFIEYYYMFIISGASFALIAE